MDSRHDSDGFLGLLPRRAGLVLWALVAALFIWLQWWSLPRQPAYVTFMVSLVAVVFIVALWRPSWGVFVTVLVIPGITTATLTVFNRIGAGRQVGVFGPAALMPSLAFVLGVWLRTWLKREDPAPNPLRRVLLIFLGLSVLSAFVAIWRYSDFWPLSSVHCADCVVNADGMTGVEAYPRIIWALVNYLTGPLLLLGICQAAWCARKAGGDRFSVRAWLMVFILLPLFLGSAAPLTVGLIQTNNVWFGAHKFYVWPWMNRINATFFDPNALGSYIILFVPWVLAAAGLLISCRWWLAFPAVAGAGALVWMCGVLTVHSGSRTAVLGMAIGVFFVLFFALLQALRSVGKKLPRIAFHVAAVVAIVSFFAAVYWLSSNAPKGIDWLCRHPRLRGTSLLDRVRKLPVKSFNGICKQLAKDRGPYASIALDIIKDMPLTGVGIGCFVTELANWKKESKHVIYVPDTACNYYLQVWSEQGSIAFAVIVVLFGLWFVHWWRVWRSAGAAVFWLFIGAGMATMMVVFMFGMHTLAHEIQCLFWVYLSQPLIAMPAGPRAQSRSGYTWVLIALVCCVYVCHAGSRLSLERQHRRFGWREHKGFHKWEKQLAPGAPRIRYTRRKSGERLLCNGIFLRQRWSAPHLHIAGDPVHVTFRLAQYTTNVVAADNAWHEIVLPVAPGFVDKYIDYEVEVDRTWTGAALGLNDDHRRLGLVLEEPSWQSEAGMYQPEAWPEDGGAMSGQDYRWTGKSAHMAVDVPEPYLRIPMIVGHLDLAESPVTASVRCAGCAEVQLSWTNIVWQDAILFCRPASSANAAGERVWLSFDVSRTMRPAEYGKPDLRELGVGVGKPVPARDFGFYNQESWHGAFNYRWAGAHARWAEQTGSNGHIVVNYLVGHPDAKDRPVRWTLFVNGEKVYEDTVAGHGWRAVQIESSANSWNDLHAMVDRMWMPGEYGKDDTRELGFAIRF